MLTKFETTSKRVKGLAFHPTRPWILASLHNGVIQLWDYQMATLIDRFEEHDGPVRGVDFHGSQPLFVSGGDDYKIKVWNYQQRRCLFNLLGHLDYIRTVQFHHEHPWVLSASDDQTLRIWNWQSRQCLSVLTGHNHYVMCAQFHPTKQLVLSASLDQTARVWDISGLCGRNTSIGMGAGGVPPGGASPFGGAGAGGGGGMGGAGGASSELFGGSDFQVKHVLDGHTRGVNWASFHKSSPLIVTGADDREVKLWRMNDVNVWEVDTLRGHINNVSCVLFHPSEDLVISDSEDKTIRIWDISKQEPPRIMRREYDRYWVLDAHPTLNLVAAGHDSGLVIFKLRRERPAYTATGSVLYYQKDSYIRMFAMKDRKRANLKAGQDVPLIATRAGRAPSSGPQRPRTLVHNASNKTQTCLLLMSDVRSSHSSTYELFVHPKGSNAETQSFKGSGRAAVFVSRNRFCVLDRSRQLYLKDLKNETKRRLAVPDYTVQDLFEGGVGHLLLRCLEGMVLFDVQMFKVVAALQIPSRFPVKYVSWSPRHRLLAMWSKTTVYITDDKLSLKCSVTEPSRVKSGVWERTDVFIYTTATHIKYLLPNGDNGVIRTLSQPIYLTGVSGEQLFYIDRQGAVGSLHVDATEYRFKVALTKRRHKEVLRIMRSNKLVGSSIIAYLQRKGFPEVALHFVQDPKTKFGLALECGNIRVALDCALELDDEQCWHKLGVEALRQGNHQVVEAAYQKTKNFSRLSFLYVITGNVDRLGKMLLIARRRQDVMDRFHNALYLGSAEERLAVLEEAGHIGLAFLLASTHGLAEDAARLAELYSQRRQERIAAATAPEQLEREIPTCEQLLAGGVLDRARLLYPPTPIVKEDNWPLLEVPGGYFDHPPEDATEEDLYDEDDDDEEDGADYDDDDVGASQFMDLASVDDDWATAAPAAETAANGDAADGDGWGDLDLDLGDDLDIDGDDLDLADGAGAASAAAEAFVLPRAGKTPQERWGDNASTPAELIAAGTFDIACHMLSRQIGLADFAPLKPKFVAIYQSARLQMPSLPNSAAMLAYAEEPANCPVLPFTYEQLEARVKQGCKLFTDHDLAGALDTFRDVLATVPLVTVTKRSQEAELKKMVALSAEYITALRLDAARNDAKDAKRKVELAAYFTRCKLKPVHVLLGLKMAVSISYKTKNFKTTASFCRRILELCATANKAAIAKIINVAKIRKLLKVCETHDTNAHDIDFKDTVHFDLCAKTLTPIYKGEPQTTCPYSGSHYRAEFDGQLDETTRFCQIGAEASGLQVYRDAREE